MAKPHFPLAAPWPRARVQGMTLIELLVTIAIAAIVTAYAVPSFKDTFTRARLTAHSNTVMSSLLLARGESIKRNGRVVLCMSADGSTCTTTGTWEQGWIVFVDTDSNATRATGETIIQKVAALSGVFKLTSVNSSSTTLTSVSFTGSGSPVSAATFTLCDTKDTSKSARQIALLATGRPRITPTTVTSCT